MAVKFQNWEIRGKDGLLTKITTFHKYSIVGTILGKEYVFSSDEITLFDDRFLINDTNEEVPLGNKSKLYRAFLREDAVVLRYWNMFWYDGTLYLEGYPYKSNEYVTIPMEFPLGPYFLSKNGRKILLDLREHESKSKITKDYFPYGEAPDLFD